MDQDNHIIMRKMGECKNCKQIKPIQALGLCSTCYIRFRRGNIYLDNGELKEFRYNHLYKNAMKGLTMEEFMEKTGLNEEEAGRYYKRFKN